MLRGEPETHLKVLLNGVEQELGALTNKSGRGGRYRWRFLALHHAAHHRYLANRAQVPLGFWVLAVGSRDPISDPPIN